MEDIVIVRDKISLEEVRKIAEATFGEMVKAVADIERHVLAIGSEYHADAETVLLDDGSAQKDLWGFNIYHERPRDTWIEYYSLINIRPKQNNRSQIIEDEGIKSTIARLTNQLIEGD